MSEPDETTSGEKPAEQQAGTGGIGQMSEQQVPDGGATAGGAPYDLTPESQDRDPKSESGT